jgi:hypothetical protein
MAALLLRFPNARSWGIYSGRNTVLGNLSAHAEGRALDVGCSITVGNRIVDYLLALRYQDEDGNWHRGPAGLGISVIIHNRVIYSAKSPTGRRYDGDPHTDHVHIEMTRKAATRLRLTRAKRVLGVAP